MKKNSLEIIPKQSDRIKTLSKELFNEIYIAYIPGDSFNNIVEASKFVIEQGFISVPHIPARNILDEDQLDLYLSNLASIGVKKILVLGGSGNKKGVFEKTFDLYETGLFNKYKFEQINIAGHPEGNPQDKNSDMNLLKKCQWIVENRFKSAIVTQWTFDISKTNQWIEKIKKETNSIHKNHFDINVGIAGPAKITTLINYAKICGVSATTIIARNKNIGLRKLIKHDPKVIIDGLVGYDNLHFFPFGGIKELIKWRNEV